MCSLTIDKIRKRKSKGKQLKSIKNSQKKSRKQHKQYINKNTKKKIKKQKNKKKKKTDFNTVYKEEKLRLHIASCRISKEKLKKPEIISSFHEYYKSLPPKNRKICRTCGKGPILLRIPSEYCNVCNRKLKKKQIYWKNLSEENKDRLIVCHSCYTKNKGCIKISSDLKVEKHQLKKT